jgi:thiamine-phosphate pyrophosphorylase
MIDFRLYGITDRHRCRNRSLAETVEKLVRNGVRAIQLREKDLTDRELYRLAKEITAITLKHGARLLINGRPDIAHAVGADGVHCPSDGLPPREIRRCFPGLLTGQSIHSLGEMRQAVDNGADFLLYGSVFKTSSKPVEPKGLKALEKICARSPLPVFAVGGIDSGNAESCIEHGAAGVACISALMEAESIRKTIKQFKLALGTL